jgi:DNA-binding MarR family transcriptional regulator
MSTAPVDLAAARELTLAGDLRVVIGRLRRRLREEANPGDLTPSQAAALSRLEREGSVTLTALARAEGVRPQSMGATISVLEAGGLVSGAPDPTDGRQTLLSLTPAAREKFSAVRAVREDWLFRAIQSTLEPHEQEELADVIKLLKRLVDS